MYTNTGDDPHPHYINRVNKGSGSLDRTESRHDVHFQLFFFLTMYQSQLLKFCDTVILSN